MIESAALELSGKLDEARSLYEQALSLDSASASSPAPADVSVNGDCMEDPGTSPPSRRSQGAALDDYTLANQPS